jgi:membrane protease YdiL (CAAX protease family)
MNYDNLTIIRMNGLSWSAFFEHVSQTLMIQVVYYPLFAMLLFPAFRKRYGLWWSLFINGVLFTVYHTLFPTLFPEIVHSYAAGYLFITFIAYMLLYIWSESLILVMLVHLISNAVLLASKGIVYESRGMIVLPVLIAIGTLVAMIRGALKEKDKPIQDPDFWISINLKD